MLVTVYLIRYLSPPLLLCLAWSLVFACLSVHLSRLSSLSHTHTVRFSSYQDLLVLRSFLLTCSHCVAASWRSHQVAFGSPTGLTFLFLFSLSWCCRAQSISLAPTLTYSPFLFPDSNYSIYLFSHIMNTASPLTILISLGLVLLTSHLFLRYHDNFSYDMQTHFGTSNPFLVSTLPLTYYLVHSLVVLSAADRYCSSSFLISSSSSFHPGDSFVLAAPSTCLIYPLIIITSSFLRPSHYDTGRASKLRVLFFLQEGQTQRLGYSAFENNCNNYVYYNNIYSENVYI